MTELTPGEVTTGWVLYILIIVILCAVGLAFDLWYTKVQRSIFENPPEYLIGENEFN